MRSKIAVTPGEGWYPVLACVRLLDAGFLRVTIAYTGYEDWDVWHAKILAYM